MGLAVGVRLLNRSNTFGSAVQGTYTKIDTIEFLFSLSFKFVIKLFNVNTLKVASF